jgi:hypothetical protein
MGTAIARNVRDPIPHALETDWLVEAAGFEPLHIRIGICQDSQPGGAGLEFVHHELKARPDRRLKPVEAG